ncbi:hypothetical protein ACQKWADRAFT_301988 [Trichoderma austrokoningii]
MQHAVIQSYYDELTTSSLGNAVDALWANILPLYFPVIRGFGIELQASSQTADSSVIRCVKKGQQTKMCILEDRRVELESSEDTWNDALERLTGYMVAVRTENTDPAESLYGVVTVGRCLRFYELRGGEMVLRECLDSGRVLGFGDDEVEIDRILCDIATQ